MTTVPDWWPTLFINHVEVFDVHFPTLSCDAIGTAVFAMPLAAEWRADPEALLKYWRERPAPTLTVTTRFD